MSFDINDFFNSLNNGNVIKSYKGAITSELINGILEEVENKMLEAGENSKLRKKVYNVLVEALQNLYHHVDELPNNVQESFSHKFGILYITKNGEDYQIITGNFISRTKIKFLKDKIDKINSLSKDELKDMYKFILNHQKITEKGGGGLGLVDIARKTGHKLDYSFKNYNEDYYFFVLDILIS
jgi:hypothetical protein